MKICAVTAMFERHRRTRPLHDAATRCHQQPFNSRPVNIALDRFSPQAVSACPNCYSFNSN